METRAHFQQIIDYRIFFAFLVLFTRAVFAESVTDLTTSNILIKKNGNEIEDTTTDGLTTTTVLTSESTFKPSSKHSLPLSTLMTTKQSPVATTYGHSVATQVATTHGHSVATQVATTQRKESLALDAATTTESHIIKKHGSKHTTDTVKQNITDTQTESVTPSETSATIGIVSNATTVMQKAYLTSGTPTTSSNITPTPKSSRPRSKGRPEQGTGKGQRTTPRQDMHPQSTETPGMSYDDGTSETLSTEIGETMTVSGSTATPSPQRNHSIVLIIAMVLFFLLILAIVVACLYCRRRRRSGSTSFNTAQWAGQAALPDDIGLDKDVEQAPLATGETGTRRATLTTFFGKRQSRVASIAMEEIDGKEREEAQQLIDENAGRDSSPQGPGEANGKVPETTQEKTPLTQVE